MKQAILFGDYDAKFHPANDVEPYLRDILPVDTMIFTEDRQKLDRRVISNFDLVVCYPEFDNDYAYSDSQTASLLDYTAKGGGLMLIHNGISIQTRPELAQLVGAKFTGHPAYEKLPEIHYTVVDKAHPVTQGVGDFSFADEAYLFDLDPLADLHILLEQDFEGQQVPAAWVRPFGEGRVFYSACGHQAEGFRNSEFTKMLINAAKWCMKQS